MFALHLMQFSWGKYTLKTLSLPGLTLLPIRGTYFPGNGFFSWSLKGLAIQVLKGQIYFQIPWKFVKCELHVDMVIFLAVIVC